jgi:hypothetical protein
MELQINIDVSAIAAHWARAPEITSNAVTRAMDEAVLLLQREAADNSPIGALGNLRNNWFSNVVPSPAQVVGLMGTPVEYAEAVELGTKPHFPPVEPLADWVRAKLDVPEKEVQSVAFAIARKIAKSGTKAQLFLRDVVDRTNPQIQRVFQIMVEKLLQDLVTV